VLLDRRKVKFWQKIVFGFMALLMVAFLLGTGVYQAGCAGQTSQQDQLTQDIKRAKAAVAARPDDPAAHRQLAQAYLSRANAQQQGSAEQQADWRAAGAAYEDAVELLAKQKGAEARRERVTVLEELAGVYLFLQDYQLATSVYGQLTDLRPKRADYFFDMATIAINAGDTNTALLAFQRFLELDPESPEAGGVRQWIKDNTPSATPSPATTKGTDQ
jgi:tetratricopeptide (TPR) repeat protein